VPTVGATAASVASPPQTVWSGPASDGVGLSGSTVIITSSVLGVQEPLVIVHASVYVVPPTPVNSLAGSAGSLITPPAPETMVQRPVPTKGTFPSRLVGPHTVLSGPALATVGVDSNVTTTSSVVDPHALVTVQRSV